jgi:hypothetical protein
MLSMHSSKPVEHFVTLFDSKFLPMGMCLHASLMKHGQSFHLWILCMDELVDEQLQRLDLKNVTLIPLAEFETEALLTVKPDRTKREYCWTVTPFAPQVVFDRNPEVQRVTYLDADLFFFDNPQILLNEFNQSGKSVLITDHAYAPQYDKSLAYGRFCVQFMTFRRTEGGFRVMQWWQDRCLEWCHARIEDGRFGDQKYLDCWPDIFADDVHVLKQVEKTLAPWNVRFFSGKLNKLSPVFFHFHSLRIISSEEVILYKGYRIGSAGENFYDDYVLILNGCFERLRQRDIPIPFIPDTEKLPALRKLKRWLTKTGRSLWI